MTTEQFLEMCHNGVDEGIIFRGPVRPNAREALEMTKEAGHTIVMITDRSFGSTPYASQQATYDWLRSNNLLFDELYFSADKTCVPTDIFVEDKLENYEALLSKNVPCVLINRPWNADDSKWRFRLDDVIDYAELVNSLVD